MLQYTLASGGPVTLSIYNISGQIVEIISQGVQETGEHVVRWDASAYSSGIYFARLQMGASSQSIRMTLIK
jgi:hypothetical protein